MNTETKPITASELKAEVIRVAAEKPDYVYALKDPKNSTSCTYQRDGEPSCIVGHALHRLGVSPDLLVEFDTTYELGMSVGDLFENFPQILDDEVEDPDEWTEEGPVEFLTRVQIGQDSGIAWGQAVKDAEL